MSLPTYEKPPSSTVETLERVRELLSDPNRWTQGFFARNAEGAGIGIDGIKADKAAAFCILGALFRVDGPYGFPAEEAIRNALPRGVQGIPDYNDSRRHRSVLKLLDKAIAKARQAPPRGSGGTGRP